MSNANTIRNAVEKALEHSELGITEDYAETILDRLVYDEFAYIDEHSLAREVTYQVEVLERELLSRVNKP